MFLLSKFLHFHLMSGIFKPSASFKNSKSAYEWKCKQIRANIQVVQFVKPKNLEPNAFKKLPEIHQIAKPKHLLPKLSKFSFPESGRKFANMATRFTGQVSVEVTKEQWRLWSEAESHAPTITLHNRTEARSRGKRIAELS